MSGDGYPDDVGASDIDDNFGEPEQIRAEGELVVSFYEEQDAKEDNPEDYIKSEVEFSSKADETEIVHIDIEENNDLELIAEVIFYVMDEEVPDYNDDNEKIKKLADKVKINTEKAEIVDYNLI